MIVSPYFEALSSNHQYQAESNDCGPYSAAIVLNALKGSHLEGSELAIRLNRVRWWGMVPVLQRIRNWATFPWTLRYLFRKEGLHSDWRIFQSVSVLYERLVRAQLSIVIIGNYQPPWAHYKMLVAHDPVKGWGFVNPAQRNGELQWDSHQYFLKHWSKFCKQIISVDDIKIIQEETCLSTGLN